MTSHSLHTPLKHPKCLRMSYDGTRYSGWQKQPNATTIQGELESALQRMGLLHFKTLGSSRTDQGVHAFDQVVRVEIDKNFENSKLQKGLNALMPKDIAVTSCIDVDSGFHPIADCKSKMYVYSVCHGAVKSPFLFPYQWDLGTQTVDLEAIKKAAVSMIGNLDYKAFCASDSDARTTVRNVLDIKIDVLNSRNFRIWVLGRGFLKHMVRSMVGTLVEVGTEKRSIESVGQLFESKKREDCGVTAPSNGLCLYKVFI